MHIGDRVYFKPWHCLLDVEDTMGMCCHEEYEPYENRIHNISDTHRDIISINQSSWNFTQNVVDRNRKVI